MQVITSWDDLKTISMPKNVSQALVNHLIEPFNDEAGAKAFWSACPTVLFFFEQSDSLESLSSLEKSQHLQAQFALDYPEYREELIEGYVIQLAILNDEGSGVYLVIDPHSKILNSALDAPEA